MLKLPVELRRRCLDFLHDDAEALQALRLVNKEVGTLGTETLFRTVILNHTDESAERFTFFLRSSLNPLARRVIINTSDDPEHSGDEQAKADVLQSFGDALELLWKLANLKEVQVKFARECAYNPTVGPGHYWGKSIAETDDFRIAVLDIVFTALRQAEKVNSLTIKNLQDHMDKILFNSEEFKAVRDRLTELHLQITTEYDDACPEDSIDKPACHQGFRRDLPDLWLKPLTNQLTHLTLYSTDCYWGMYPFVDLRQVPAFPRLKSLSLGKFTIAHDWQIDWILSHGSTLEELFLDDCPIITHMRLQGHQAKPNFPALCPDASESLPSGTGRGSRNYFQAIDLRWYLVFDRFRNGLLRLCRFAISSADWTDGSAFEQRYRLSPLLLDTRYCIFDCGIGPTQWIPMGTRGRAQGYTFGLGGRAPTYVSFPQCLGDDNAALRKLLDVLYERGNVKT